MLLQVAFGLFSQVFAGEVAGKQKHLKLKLPADYVQSIDLKPNLNGHYKSKNSGRVEIDQTNFRNTVFNKDFATSHALGFCMGDDPTTESGDATDGGGMACKATLAESITVGTVKGFKIEMVYVAWGSQKAIAGKPGPLTYVFEIPELGTDKNRTYVVRIRFVSEPRHAEIIKGLRIE